MFFPALSPHRIAIRFGRFAFAHVLLAALVAVAPLRSARAQSETPASSDEEPGTSRREVLASLHEVQKKYGADAVLMEGQLLGEAVRSGSIADAAISIPGFENRDGKRFLGFKLDTGIIYNDREVTAPARPVRVWTEIVEVSLRKFQRVSLPADGVSLMLGYAHKDYVDEADLRAHLADGRGEPESAVFYVLLSDVAELIANRISGQQLLDRATVLVNGAPARLVLAPSPSIPSP